MRIDTLGSPLRILPARLVDVSAAGFSAETRAPLASGSSVGVACELHSDAFHMELQGQAKVAYCLRRDDGLYRMGLSYERILWLSTGNSGFAAAFQIMLREIDSVDDYQNWPCVVGPGTTDDFTWSR